MAEAFLEFLDATNSANSFGEFEEMWLKMGEELEMEGLPKRPLSPTPENQSTFTPVASYSPALESNWPPVKSPSSDEGRISHVEDSILTNLRRTNPEKTEQLEKRMRTPGEALPDFKEQFKTVRSLMMRIEEDYTQIKIIVNF